MTFCGAHGHNYEVVKFETTREEDGLYVNKREYDLICVRCGDCKTVVPNA